MLFVGVDLTSAFARQPRAIDLALLGDDLSCRFTQAIWPAPTLVTGRDPVALHRMLSAAIGDEPGQVWAIDGPQGLAAGSQKMRHCERVLGTPGKTPDTLPPAASGGRPFGDYIRSSVDLFAALLVAQPTLPLAGLGGAELSNAELYEIFPGSEWTVLAGQRLPKKTSRAGRAARRALMSGLGVRGLPTLPAADENDALVGAYLAWCTRHASEVVELRGLPPVHAGGELREGYILHATKAAASKSAMPVKGSPVRSSDLALEPTQIETNPEDDWASSEDLVLKLTDYGLVHGTCPENLWLETGIDYICETLAPDAPERFRLTHSSTFSGNRGWTVEPTIKPLLTKLGYSAPTHLGEQNAVTLRVQLV